MQKTRFILPNAFTSMNFLLGVFAIGWATGMFSDIFPKSDPIRMGSYFIVLCVLLDKLDGFAARLVNASSEFGAQFDSLADLIAFGLAPAFCLFFSYKMNAPEWTKTNIIFLLVVFSIYVLCAAMRLAKYNAFDADTYHGYFSGLPSTFAGALNVVFLSFVTSYNLFGAAKESPNFLYIPIVVMLISAFLMVSPLFLPKIQVRKNKWINLFQIFNILATYICGFLFVTPIPGIREYLVLLIACYLVIGFGLGIAHREEIIQAGKLAQEQKKQKES